MPVNSPKLHRAVVEHMVRQAALPFAQPMPDDAINGAVVNEIYCNPFRQ